jgi:hypothetical protein
MAEVRAIDALIEGYGVSTAMRDEGLRKLAGILDATPLLRTLVERIFVWYDGLPGNTRLRHQRCGCERRKCGIGKNLLLWGPKRKGHCAPAVRPSHRERGER